MKTTTTILGLAVMALALERSGGMAHAGETEVKGVTLKHRLTTAQLRERVKKFFSGLTENGYSVEYSLDPDRDAASFTGKYKHWLAGTIQLSNGRITWDGQEIHVEVAASKYQEKVESRIREFVEEVLK